jgi:AcrR family transcriptional regulator
MMDITEIRQSDETRSPGRPRCDVKRRCILEAAYAILSERGLSGFTIEAVAARSGSAKTTIYRWWPTKGALAMEAALMVSRDAAPLNAPETGSAIVALRAHLHAVATLFAGSYGRVISGIVAEGQSDPEVLELYRRELLCLRREEAGKILQRGVETGELVPDLDVTVTLDLMYSGLYMRLLVGCGAVDDVAWADRLFDHLLHGIVTPKHAKRHTRADA